MLSDVLPVKECTQVPVNAWLVGTNPFREFADTNRATGSSHILYN
jgi:hypothetical protein